LEDSLRVLGTLLNSFCVLLSFIGGHLLFTDAKIRFFTEIVNLTPYK
jgi:hypothetical protein